MRSMTEKEWNEENRAVCLKMECHPPIAALALMVFGAVVEEEAQEHDSNLDEMGFDLDKVPLGLSVWEGAWTAERDREGELIDTRAEGSFRRLTDEELRDVAQGRLLWIADGRELGDDEA